MSEKRKIRKIPLFLDIEFQDQIPHDKIKEVVKKVATALRQAADSGDGLAPNGDDNGFDGTFTNHVRIMCKDVVLLIENYNLHHDDMKIIEIEGKTPSEEESSLQDKYDEAVGILQNILCESGVECEYDQDIYQFLKSNDELPDNYQPYWAD